MNKIKEKILNEIDSCYASGEWGGANPEATFRKLRRLFRKYEELLWQNKDQQ